MRTDTIFYKLFLTFPNLLFELLDQPATTAQNYKFASQEVKELARRFDGVFLPQSQSFDDPIYFVEVQFQAKKDFYWRLFTESFNYLGQYQPKNDWRAIAIFCSRDLDPGVPQQYRGLLMSEQLKLVYLDELAVIDDSLSLSILHLVVEDEQTVISHTQQLVQKAQQQISDVATRIKVLELMESILIYKLATITRAEVEAMFSLSDLKQSRVYQEGEQGGIEKGKLKTVPLLLRLGLTVEQIAAELEVDVEAVQKAVNSSSHTNNS